MMKQYNDLRALDALHWHCGNNCLELLYLELSMNMNGYLLEVCDVDVGRYVFMILWKHPTNDSE